jgi:hypothetical protein
MPLLLAKWPMRRSRSRNEDFQGVMRMEPQVSDIPRGQHHRHLPA